MTVARTTRGAGKGEAGPLGELSGEPSLPRLFPRPLFHYDEPTYVVDPIVLAWFPQENIDLKQFHRPVCQRTREF